jgi:hypothetical protein
MQIGRVSRGVVTKIFDIRDAGELDLRDLHVWFDRNAEGRLYAAPRNRESGRLALAAATKSARTMQFASLNFDVSFEEIFSTFAAGACLFLVRDSQRCGYSPRSAASSMKTGSRDFICPWWSCRSSRKSLGINHRRF